MNGKSRPDRSRRLALLRCLLRSLVDSRLVALAPGAADRDPGLLGERRDEPADGVLLPARLFHNLLQCGAAGAGQQVAHDRLLAELAWHPRRAGVRGGRGYVCHGFGSLGLLRGLGGRPWRGFQLLDRRPDAGKQGFVPAVV